jgi:integrase-like protein
VRRRFAPHQLRHAHALELLHEGISLPLIQRQLGHAYLSTTGTYLEGITTLEGQVRSVAFVFDMNKVFEDLLSAVLQRALQRRGAKSGFNPAETTWIFTAASG